MSRFWMGDGKERLRVAGTGKATAKGKLLREGYVMPFGKHKGQFVAGVPTSYLVWFLRLDSLSLGLRDAIADVIARRAPDSPSPPW